ncbi:hypothetical protein EYV94_22550 [Puteibacter caeruleilacunae]|nr:hypothetical protein EYV94_22550 [Puteibacter caeruleilacunae]
MEDRFEQYIKEHREEFDFRTPSPKVWDQIEKRTTPTKTIQLRRVFARAAVIISVVCLGGLTYIGARQMGILPGSSYATSQNPEIRELLETEAYYSVAVSGKLKEINKCYETHPELEGEIKGDLQELESLYHELKRDLKENIAQKEVIEAMIKNNQTRLQIVELVLKQIDC